MCSEQFLVIHWKQTHREGHTERDVPNTLNNLVYDQSGSFTSTMLLTGSLVISLSHAYSSFPFPLSFLPLCTPQPSQLFLTDSNNEAVRRRRPSASERGRWPAGNVSHAGNIRSPGRLEDNEEEFVVVIKSADGQADDIMNSARYWRCTTFLRSEDVV